VNRCKSLKSEKLWRTKKLWRRDWKNSRGMKRLSWSQVLESLIFTPMLWSTLHWLVVLS